MCVDVLKHPDRCDLIEVALKIAIVEFLNSDPPVQAMFPDDGNARIRTDHGSRCNRLRLLQIVLRHVQLKRPIRTQRQEHPRVEKLAIERIGTIVMETDVSGRVVSTARQ